MTHYSYQLCDNLEASQRQRHRWKVDNEDDAADVEATVAKLPPLS